MKRRLWTVAAAIASLAALVAVPAAFAVYTTPKLEVRQAGTSTTFKLTQSSSEDAVASVRIFVPTGTTLTTTQAPGASLGPVKALLKLHALAGAEVPVEGNVVVAAAGQIPAALQTACIGSATPIATWVLALNIAGTPANIPLWLVPTASPFTALGPAVLQVCILSPHIPPASGGAAGGAQLVSAEFTAQGVFSAVAAGAFVSILTPWTPGTGTVNAAGTIAAPAAVAPGAVSLAARRTGAAGANVSGAVTQGGQARAGATVTIFGGARATGLKRLGRAKVAANGKFTFKARTGTFFRANAVAAAGTSATVCTQLAPVLGSVPCVNATVNGFTAQSKVVRKR